MWHVWGHAIKKSKFKTKELQTHVWNCLLPPLYFAASPYGFGNDFIKSTMRANVTKAGRFERKTDLCG